MPRIKLKPLDYYPFSAPIEVRITDLNYGGHLANDRFLALAHEARVAFLSSFGYTEMDLAGVSLIQTDAVINYLKEVFAGDILLFEVAAGEPSRNGFRLFYRISRHSAKDLVALIETGLVCFDYRNKKIQRLPQEAIQRLF